MATWACAAECRGAVAIHWGLEEAPWRWCWRWCWRMLPSLRAAGRCGGAGLLSAELRCMGLSAWGWSGPLSRGQPAFIMNSMLPALRVLCALCPQGAAGAAEDDTDRQFRATAGRMMGDLNTSGDAPFGGEVQLESQVGGWVGVGMCVCLSVEVCVCV